MPDTLIFQNLSISVNTKITYLDRSFCEDINLKKIDSKIVFFD